MILHVSLEFDPENEKFSKNWRILYSNKVLNLFIKPNFNRKNNQQVKATKQDENANPIVVDEQQPVKTEEVVEKAA